MGKFSRSFELTRSKAETLNRVIVKSFYGYCDGFCFLPVMFYFISYFSYFYKVLFFIILIAFHIDLIYYSLKIVLSVNKQLVCADIFFYINLDH